MADEFVTSIAGLFTSPNPLSKVPSGALREALNCVINYAGIAESRRGTKYIPYTFGTGTSRATGLLSYAGSLLVPYDSNKLAYDSGIAFVDYSGAFAAPPRAIRIRGCEANLNLYLTSARGPYVIDTLAVEPKASGQPRGPLVTSRTSPTRPSGDPGDGWMPADCQVAYIAVIGTRDANENVKLGQASPPFYVVNPPDMDIEVGQINHLAPGIGRILNTPVLNKYYAVNTKIAITMVSADVNVPDGVYDVGSTGAGSGFPYNDSSATRLLFRTLSASGANSVTGTVTTELKDVLINVDLGPELTTDQFIRIYRTRASTGYQVPPLEDYFLVREMSLTSGMLSAKLVTFTDSAPDELLGDPYYNNVNVGGESPDSDPENENQQAPLCNDLTVWDDRLWGACLQERQRLDVTLLGTGNGAVFGDTSGGLGILDTVTVDGEVFTAVSPAVGMTDYEFGLFSALINPNLTQNDCIRLTAQSLAQTVYRIHGTVGAFATSKVTDLVPGRITFTTRDAAGASFDFETSQPTAWDPDPTDGLTSRGASGPNEVWFAKKEEPEAVPFGNRLSIGPRNGRIVRFKALGDRLYVFTTRGIYAISGTFPYRVDLVSKTAVILSPDSLSDLDDALFVLTTQGYTRISDAGITVLTSPIEADVKKLFGDGLPALVNLAVSCGYESYRKFIVTMPTVAADAVATQQLVWDVGTKTWTNWDRPFSALLVVPENDTLYATRNDTNKVMVERKTGTRADYCDEDFAVTISAIDDETLTLVSNTGITIGDAIWQSDIAWGTVIAVDDDGVTVTLDTDDSGLTATGATCYTGIENRVIFSERFAGKPNYEKHTPWVTYHLRDPAFSLAKALFMTERGSAEEPVDLTAYGWGEESWGMSDWGDPNATVNERVSVSDNATRASFLRVGFILREAFAQWGLLGFSIETDVESTRNSK